MEDIKGYEGKYAITSCGKVWSYARKKFLKPIKGYNGYQLVHLYDGKGNAKTFLVHRLVAEAYIPNPNNYDTVDHIDFNVKNNCVNNLRWMDRIDNCKRQPMRI